MTRASAPDRRFERLRPWLRWQICEDLFYGRLESHPDLESEWAAVFDEARVPDCLALLRLKGYGARATDLSESERHRLAGDLQGALASKLKARGQAKAQVQHLGGGLYAVFGRLDDLGGAKGLAALGRQSQAELASAWKAPVTLGLSGDPEPPRLLHRAFSRAVLDLDRHDASSGAPQPVEANVAAMVEAVQLGQRDEARRRLQGALQGVLEAGEADLYKRTLLVKVLTSLASAVPLEGETRANASAALYDMLEAMILARQVDAALTAKLSRLAECLMPLLPEGGADRAREQVRRLKLWIDDHLHEKIRLESLARRFGMSQSSLSRVFRRLSGKTLPEHLSQRRVEEAAKLLKNTTLTQQEVAERVGFKDLHYFSVVFRRLSGRTPGSLRKIDA